MKCSLGISNFLEEISSLSHSIIFLLFLCIDHWERLSYLSLLFFGTLNSDAYIFPFLICFSLLFFSQLCGFNLQPVQVVGRFSVFFLKNTAPGFQLWFYSHFWMWIIHWGLLLRLPWRTLGLPLWGGQMWRCNCLGHSGSGCTRDSGELVARAAGNIVL